MRASEICSARKLRNNSLSYVYFRQEKKYVLKLVCKMVASSTLELPYYKGIGRQRGRGLGALSQVIGRTAILFLRKYIDPAAIRVGADLLESAVPEVADVVRGKKNFKTAAKSVARQTLRKQLEGGKQKRSNHSKVWSEAVGQAETFLIILQNINDRAE